MTLDEGKALRQPHIFRNTTKPQMSIYYNLSYMYDQSFDIPSGKDNSKSRYEIALSNGYKMAQQKYAFSLVP